MLQFLLFILCFHQISSVFYKYDSFNNRAILQDYVTDRYYSSKFFHSVEYASCLKTFTEASKPKPILIKIPSMTELRQPHQSSNISKHS